MKVKAFVLAVLLLAVSARPVRRAGDKFVPVYGAYCRERECIHVVVMHIDDAIIL